MNTPPEGFNCGRRVAKPVFESNEFCECCLTRKLNAEEEDPESFPSSAVSGHIAPIYFTSFSAAGAIGGMLAFWTAAFRAARSFDWMSCQAAN